MVVGIELLQHVPQRAHEDAGRVGDGVARVVEEEPDLVAARDDGIVVELVHHLGPGGGARERAVHQHQRNLPRLVGTQEDELVGLTARHVVAEPEARDAEVPDRRALECVGQGGALLALQRDLAARDLEIGPLVLAVDFDGAVEAAPGEAGAHVGKAHHGRHGHLQAGADVRGAWRLLADDGAARRRERRAEAGVPVAVGEPAHLHGRGGLELRELASGPDLLRLVERKGERSEGKGIRAALEGHGAIGRREAPREPDVVDVARHADPRIEGLERLVGPAPEEERVGIDGGPECLVLSPGLFGTQEGELREAVETVGVVVAPEARVQGRERCVRVLGEVVPQAEPRQQLQTLRARLRARDRAACDVPVDLPRVRPVHADRRGASSAEQQREQEPRPSLPAVATSIRRHRRAPRRARDPVAQRVWIPC